jgi:hypothetical protein
MPTDDLIIRLFCSIDGIFSKNRGKTFVLMSIPETRPTYSSSSRANSTKCRGLTRNSLPLP